MSLLMVEHLDTGYGKKEIVRNLSMTINGGQMVGILGPNGCGKSTFMKALCKGIPYRGKVILEDRDLKELSEKELAKRCSYVPQRSGLAIDITALDVVMMGFQPYLGFLEMPSKEMKNKAENTLEKVGLKDLAFANYMELSEGQKRLCVLARSLVTDAKLLLMDEPDAALDFAVRNSLLQLVAERVKSGYKGALLTLHDANLALAYCDYIYLMKQGELIGGISPKEEPGIEMEQKLSVLYGTVHLLEYICENGEKKWAMVQP